MQSRQSVSECVVKHNLHENNFVLRIIQPRKNNVIVFLHELKMNKNSGRWQDAQLTCLINRIEKVILNLTHDFKWGYHKLYV